MFTGIVEGFGKVIRLDKNQDNLDLTLTSDFNDELKVDQSVAHNGVCLTVTEVNSDHYKVTAIQETLDKTNIGSLGEGDLVNLERCMKLGDRLDGHIVQGHVDITGTVTDIKAGDGSWEFVFTHNHPDYFTVPKGSITVNGVSLTVVQSEKNLFSVCIIPYTFEHTNFKSFGIGDKVNLEFDVIGKYLDKYAKVYLNK